MAQRRIGQEDFFARPEPRAASLLAELAGLLDWGEIDRALTGASAEAKGEPGWPPLALVRKLLPATWHDLSDIKLAEALDDRASFHRFCGFAAHEPALGAPMASRIGAHRKAQNAQKPATLMRAPRSTHPRTPLIIPTQGNPDPCGFSTPGFGGGSCPRTRQPSPKVGTPAVGAKT